MRFFVEKILQNGEFNKFDYLLGVFILTYLCSVFFEQK